MRLALMGQKLGTPSFIVIEQVSELDVLLRVAAEMGIDPTLGVRIKLSSEGSGRWAQSGGEKSKFGLNSAQLMQVIERLRRPAGRRWLQADPLPPRLADHRHPLHQARAAGGEPLLRGAAPPGLDITHVDVGGGLGVDYDGSQSTNAGLGELLRAGVRQRHRVHARRDVPRAGAADAAPDQRVGARAHGAPRLLLLR
jgi:arginine decarboxylase